MLHGAASAHNRTGAVGTGKLKVSHAELRQPFGLLNGSELAAALELKLTRRACISSCSCQI
jgi:hypothetical protein